MDKCVVNLTTLKLKLGLSEAEFVFKSTIFLKTALIVFYTTYELIFILSFQIHALIVINFLYLFLISFFIFSLSLFGLIRFLLTLWNFICILNCLAVLRLILEFFKILSHFLIFLSILNHNLFFCLLDLLFYFLYRFTLFIYILISLFSLSIYDCRRYLNWIF